MNRLEPHYAGVRVDDRTAGPRCPVHVVLDNVRSAYNVGSIFRTCDAGRVAHLHLCGLTAYPPNVKLEKTALGATDYVPWTHHRTTDAALARLAELQVPLVAVETTDEAVSYLDFEWPRPVALVLGNEVDGLAPDVVARCVAAVQIPMHGFKNSLNVATAFGVILFELRRQWRIGDGGLFSPTP